MRPEASDIAKRFFTQGVSLLTNGQTTIGHIKTALLDQGFEVVKESQAQENWAFGGPSLVIPFLPEVNGYAAVDLVNHPWPNSMGDPKTDSIIFAAWSIGNFGPFAFPGSLTRARQHAWAWKGGQTVSEGHAGFVRLRISYVFGAGAPAGPAHCDPVAEMTFLSRVVIVLLQAPGVICYFNPNGEVLRDYTSFRQIWDACVEQQKTPLPLWMNIRFFNLGEGLGFMDTVGNSQLNIRDVEAAFPLDSYDPGEVDYYLRNVTHYQLGLDREMQSGEDIDGPGESNLSWTLEILDQGVVDPPRRVLRLFPKTSRRQIEQALSALGRSR